MKKQPNNTIKAHLIRSALYLVLLLAVCVIPFALGQRSSGGRNTNEISAAQQPQVPQFPLSRLRDKAAAPPRVVAGPPITNSRPVAVVRTGSILPRPEAGTTTPAVCEFHVLIVHADTGVPTQLQSEILAEPNVLACDLFDATTGTPTLAQLQQYEIVVPYSDVPFLDGDTLGNNLADYVDGGGVVVQYGFAHFGPAQPFGINGRWVTDGYNPYDYSTNLEFNSFGLGTFNAAHPLMAGVTALNSNFANIVTPNPAATEVAQNSLGESLVAFRPVGTHTTVGVTAYVGFDATQSGDWGKVIVNAGNWLNNCLASPTPTPTATPSPTPTPSASPS